MSEWFNYAAAGKILVFGLLVGAALPALFAIGTRVNAVGVGASTTGSRRPLLIVFSWTIYLLVLVVVVIGVLFIARDFLGHHFGWYLLGAEPE